MNRLLINNIHIVNEGDIFEGAIVIEGETIAEVLHSKEQPATICQQIIDGGGAYLLP